MGNSAASNTANMGLKGWAGQIGNLSAMGFICYAFWSAQQTMDRTATEDRQMFRQELAAQRKILDRQAEAVTNLTTAVHRLAAEVKLKIPNREE